MLQAGRLWSGALTGVLAALLSQGIPGTAVPASASSQLRHEQVLYSFRGPNGAGPLSGVTPGTGGVLYGTTVFGGKHGDGDVFRLTPDGSRYKEAILHTFGGGDDGARPGGNVVANSQGDLFGVTDIGGADGRGTVFELVPSGSRYVEHVIHNFTGGADGGQPLGTPVIDSAGDIFSVTQFGGTTDGGVAFELAPHGGGYRELVLHNFPFGGALPQAGLTMSPDGSLFGTGYGAGDVHTNGLVFRLRKEKKSYVYTDLYNFKGGSDGSNPFSTLTLDASTGGIFGTTEYGGGAGGEGTVFELTPNGTGYTEEVLHGFKPEAGALPQAPVLLEPNGDLFGTTSQSGTGCSGTGCGTVFELVPSVSSYTFSVVYRFTGPPDGAEPQWGPLVAEPNGDLLGTTRSGGVSTTCSDGGPGGATGCGTLFEVTP
jgi:uncharacterized repeat protein (TIGR03803 family)